MIPDVSEHALSRYCERIVGKPAAELTREERTYLRDYIAACAALPRPLQAIRSWSKRTPAALYIVKDNTVATVLAPGMEHTLRLSEQL